MSYKCPKCGERQRLTLHEFVDRCMDITALGFMSALVLFLFVLAYLAFHAGRGMHP